MRSDPLHRGARQSLRRRGRTDEGRCVMSVSTASPAIVQIRRGHLLGLLACVAAAAAAITWALTTHAADDTGRHAVSAPASIASSPARSTEAILFPTRRVSASGWTGV